MGAGGRQGLDTGAGGLSDSDSVTEPELAMAACAGIKPDAGRGLGAGSRVLFDSG
jgi:hypothetical protein